jgi:exopolysaccharide biosynthesis polyprenyl glycosylphosphotransferase
MRSTVGTGAATGGVDLSRNDAIWRGIAVASDVRLKREITHRQLVVATLRRYLRVWSLHVVDGTLVAALAFAWTSGLSFSGAPRSFVPAIVAIHLLSLNALATYERGEGARTYWRIVMAVALANLTLAVLAQFPPRLPLEPTLFVLFGAMGCALLITGRVAIDKVARQVQRRGGGLRRALLVGNVEEVGPAIEAMRVGGSTNHYILGHLTASGQHDPAALAAIDEIARVIEGEMVKEVIVSSVLPPKAFREVATCCFEGGVALFVTAAVPISREYRAEPLQVGGCTLLRIHPARLEMPALLVKRAFDLVVAGAALVLTAPLMALIALAIRIDSPGPVFYRSRRVGLGGRHFDMWKFRSMTRDAEKREQELAHLNIYANGTFKIANDPRVTRVGAWLRRTSLDELPQLFNVLNGSMSLVGPRPALPDDLHRYEPHHFQRLTVIPGITGPWQVGGRNLITDFETIIGMESQYIQSWSFWLDLKILLRTPVVVWRGEGAY